MRPTLRVAIAAILLALGGFGIVAVTSLPAGAKTPLDGTSANLVGTWKVTYRGGPAVAEIRSTAAGRYSMIAKTPWALVGGSSCQIPAGTALQTFAGHGRSYTGQISIWSSSGKTCSFTHSYGPVSLRLNGNTAIESDGGEVLTLTRLSRPRAKSQGPRPSQFVESIPTPGQVSVSPKHLGQNASLALLFVFLVALPATIFNSTLTENYERVTRGFRRVRGPLAKIEASVNCLPGGVLLVGFGVVGGVIYGLLDPGFGFNQTTVVLVAALAGALIVVTGIFELLRVVYLGRRHRRRARLVAYPLALVMAVILVAFSRLGHIQPGYIFGLTCARWCSSTRSQNPKRAAA